MIADFTLVTFPNHQGNMCQKARKENRPGGAVGTAAVERAGNCDDRERRYPSLLYGLVPGVCEGMQGFRNTV